MKTLERLLILILTSYQSHSINMTIEPEPNSTPEHILDWLEDTLTFLPSFLDDPYNANDINGYQWWDQVEDQHLISNSSINSNSSTPTTTLTTVDLTSTTTTIPASNPSRKRKLPNNSNDQNQRLRGINSGSKDGVEEEEVVKVKRSVSSKKGAAKATGGNNSGNGNNKEGRWAEQLLNPCAVAITNGNLSRVQHLLYVLHDLASQSGDANHRLAFHGLAALTHHLSLTTVRTTSTTPPQTLPISFASTEPRFFKRSLEKFYEVSPWFIFPNTIANASILQILSQEPDTSSRNLHILDIGVSHGLQWPTFLEALSRRPGGPPPLVRITVLVGGDTSFSTGPPRYDFTTQLLRFAKTINLNLQFNLLTNHPLQTLNSQIIKSVSNDETLIVCAQFRLHQLNPTFPHDDRTKFLKTLRSFKPQAVILCENDMESSCNNCGDFSIGFARRVEYLWRFMDSTSAAFKGREYEERRVVEGEAATAFMNGLEMNEGKHGWCEKMRGAGFIGEGFGEDPLDGGRALLRKYDSNWEMRVDEKDGCICLWWKGQPVSFCSLWKVDKNVNDG